MKRSSLSVRRQSLITLLSDVWFGRIEAISIRDGDPVIGPEIRIVRTISLSTDDACRDRASADFELKEPVVRMLAEFDRIGDGMVARINVKAGLPCFMQVEGPIDQWRKSGERRSR